MRQFATIAARAVAALTVLAWVILPAAHGARLRAFQAFRALRAGDAGQQQPGQIQQPTGTWQKPGEIQQPKGTWQKPGEIQVPKGIQAIQAHESGCEQRLTTVADALFEFDKATLGADAEQTLSVLGPQIAQRGEHPIVIEGYTDSIGSDAHNQRLSEQRAAAVRAWLAAHRFVPASTPIKGYGKTRPVAPNANPDGSDNPTGRQKNRRVEVVIKTCP
ncbi:MAG TPA: OmpA family protein [Thermoanaerobaculia bacterium]|jgi:outer membrane protein OmpA-like peptidoglycan-associated protein|nr:OmpA family protein [Thermoanaerobaculia bacterium]